MNSGIYGMTSGQSLAGRKVKALGGTTPASIATATVTSFSGIAHATPVSAAATPATVRTRLLSVADKGAIRALAIAGGGTDNTRVEIIVDGVTIWDRTISMVSGTMYVVVGFVGSASPSFCPDYIPFDSSMELWVTRSTLTTTDYAFTVDLHQ